MTHQQTDPWSYKPWWCQPWSIVLTGTLLITGSWFASHRLWITTIIALPITAWMAYFLLIWPRLMRSSSEHLD